ncbi:hypothetical protein MSIMFI_01844 [Mycobacterium simulans]|nr:hypothetical protein MSIMFI_01844 [Mycobacterium simulans]
MLLGTGCGRAILCSSSTDFSIIAISARLITRTLFSSPSLPAAQHFLELLRDDPRLPEWRLTTGRALARPDELACCKLHLNLRRPDPMQLKVPFRPAMGTTVDRIELARRGLMTEDAFYTVASSFAVAIVDDQPPAFEVGHLGPHHTFPSASTVAPTGGESAFRPGCLPVIRPGDRAE